MFLPALLASLSASAQEITAQSLLPPLKPVTTAQRVALSDTDVVLLVTSGIGHNRTSTLVRQGEGDAPVWQTEITMPSVERLDYSLDWRHLALSGDRLLLFTSNGRELLLREIDPETGAIDGPRALVEHAAEPLPARFTARLLVSQDSEPAPTPQVPMVASPDQGWFLVNEREDSDGTLHLRAFDADLTAHPVVVDGEGCTEGSVSIDDDGTVLLTGQRMGALCIAAYPRSGEPWVAEVQIGGVSDLWSVSAPDGLRVVAQLGSGRDQVLQLLHLQDGEIRYRTSLDGTLLTDALEGREDGPGRALRRMPGVALVEAMDDGGVLVGLQSAVETTTVTETVQEVNGVEMTSESTRVRYSATDMVVLAVDGDGTLQWAQQLPTKTESSRMEDVFVQHRMGADTLELIHCRERMSALYGTFSDINVFHQEVSLADGSLSPERALFPGYGSRQGFLASWSVPLGEDGWFVASSVSSGRFIGWPAVLGSHIRLDAAPPDTFPDPAPDFSVARDDSGFLLGRSLGATSTANAHWNDRIRGLSLGAAGAIGGLWLSEKGLDNIGVTVFFGGAVSARFIGGAPKPGPWTLGSPALQAGYIKTDRRKARRRALRWGVVGFVAGSMVYANTVPEP